MNDAVSQMLARYQCTTISDYENALKEIFQEIALLGLWRAKFFEHAAFYGGTALRILYQLDRFSEDLDFSLLKPDLYFSLDRYNSAVQDELKGFGFEAVVEKKRKYITKTIESAFIKAEAKTQLLHIAIPKILADRIQSNRVIKIKFEIDTDPPPHFVTESKLLLQPIPFFVNSYPEPDLFAGKVHALLCRSWKQQIKGRDWYDLVWYVGRKTPLHLVHLQARLTQTGHCEPNAELTLDTTKQLLRDRIAEIDFLDARKDVAPFIRDQASIESWSKEFFLLLVERLQGI